MDMLITFTPQRRDDTLALEKDGDAIIINGLRFDFGPLADGHSLPAAAIGSAWIAGPVDRVGGALTVPVIWPHGPGAHELPEPLLVETDGPVEFLGAAAQPGGGPLPGTVDLGAAAPTTPTLSQYDKDKLRYQRRALAKDTLLAEMAAENMARVRAGVWTVSDLTALMQDPTLKATLDLIATLSFEMAAQALASSTHPLLTADIKAGWVDKLQANFYLEP